MILTGKAEVLGVNPLPLPHDPSKIWDPTWDCSERQ
jgi:hypothetical protein